MRLVAIPAPELRGNRPTCWRSNVVISFLTPLDAACMAEFPDVDWSDPVQADQGCRHIVETIDVFLRQR